MSSTIMRDYDITLDIDDKPIEKVSVKRFAAFRGQDYYPAGGWNDFLSAHGTREDAIGALLDAAIESSFDWAQVVDLATGEIVYDTDKDHD